mgnify:CR=1 FL=1|tara:strand:+ start:991 stop:1476 length:486 start_codon:yes stop_codon:yes gene_type:complete
MRSFLLLFSLLASYITIAQNLQSSELVISPISIGANQLLLPNVAGEALGNTINLNVSEELRVKNISNQFKWCIYAKISSNYSADGSIIASLSTAMPPNRIDFLTSNTPLELTYSDVPFISGQGSINSAIVQYAVYNVSVPQALNQTYQIIYTIQSGLCPTP